MPVPFLMLVGCPSFLIPSAVMTAFYFGRKLLNDAALLASFHRAGASSGLQLLLMFIIPAFIFGFNSISPKYQTPYLILLPVIKLVAKNIMSRIIDSNDDMKPVEIIFNIDCFNAIYVSLAMQRATTISTSLIIILIDIFQGCVSVYDVYLGFLPLNQFMSKLPAGHPLHGKNFLEVAIALDQEVELLSRKNQTDNATLPGPMVQTKSVKLPNVRIGVRASTKISVAPVQTAKENAYPDVSMKQNLFSSESRAAFLHATRKLLFTSEFVILVEYTEVIMPVFYSLVIAASYHLPNRAFYSTISNIGEHELWHMVASVLMYAALELASLVAMNVVLGWITGVSPIRQVGFVLDDQRELVQSKLLSWVFYAVQNSLEHFGADFSFQFKWMRSD